MPIAIHQTVHTPLQRNLIQRSVFMVLVTTPTVVQIPQQLVGKHIIFPNQVHPIPLYASKKSQTQFLLTMHILFTTTSDKNMTLKMTSLTKTLNG